MNMKNMYQLVKELEGMKVHTRTAYTSQGKQESIAEHSWRVAMLALLLGEEDLDMEKVLKIAIIHDLGENYEGDISAKLQSENDDKYDREVKSLNRLKNLLSPEKGHELVELWKEYEESSTKEAQFVKAVDKVETVIQHNQGKNPDGFDYEFNLNYGEKYTDAFRQTKSLKAIANEEIHQILGDEKNNVE